MVRTVELDETKHAVTFLQGLRQLRREKDLCDFIIQVQDEEYCVHKTVLAVRSPYFKAMLRHNLKETQEGKVQMKEVDAECVKSCIEFMYSGKFDIPDGKTGKLLHVAIMMQLEDVKEAICDILGAELYAKNFYQTQSIAEMYQLSSIMKKCTKYYEENFMAISTQPGFQNEKKSHLVNIFKSKRLKLSEDDKLAASLSWSGKNPEKKRDLSMLIKCIKLGEVSLTYLTDLLENHPVISNDFSLYRLMNEPLVDYAKTGRNVKKKSCSKDFFLLFVNNSDFLQSYNPTTDVVQKYHEASYEHLEFSTTVFTAVSMDSYIYVLCKSKSIYRLNFTDINSKWERVQDMTSDHGWCPPSVSISGSLFVIGSSGSDINRSSESDDGDSDDSDYVLNKVVEKFDPVANKWLRLADKPTAVDAPTLVSLDDSIYCIGGNDGFEELDSFCRFTPSTSKWVDLQPMKTAKCGCGAAVVEERIFVMGGYRNEGRPRNELEHYDVISEQWTSLSPMIDGHSGWIAAYHKHGWIFSFSRFTASDTIEKYVLEKYDIANDRWSKVEFKGVSDVEICDCVAVQY